MIIDILDRIYQWLPQTNVVWRSLRYSCRVIANIYAEIFMPILYRERNVDSDTIIVSLTSFPARIKNVWMTCATLLNQNAENIHVVLWLSKEQFPEDFNSLPSKLLKMKEYGLDIRFVDDDLRPHKKYFYALNEFPNNDILTVDDDILYSTKLVPSLIECHHRHPNCVICNRGIIVKRDLYKNWKTNKRYDEERSDIMPTGVGGVLYPAHIFEGTPIHDAEAIKQTCLNGDDLWLNFMTRLKGHNVVQTGFRTGLVTILSSQDSALCNENVGEDKNDKQISLLSKWAEQKLNCNYYVNIL